MGSERTQNFRKNHSGVVRGTADPSAALGMTKGGVALPFGILPSSNRSPLKRRPSLCHPERSRGICSLGTFPGNVYPTLHKHPSCFKHFESAFSLRKVRVKRVIRVKSPASGWNCAFWCALCALSTYRDAAERVGSRDLNKAKTVPTNYTTAYLNSSIDVNWACRVSAPNSKSRRTSPTPKIEFFRSLYSHALRRRPAEPRIAS